MELLLPVTQVHQDIPVRLQIPVTPGFQALEEDSQVTLVLLDNLVIPVLPALVVTAVSLVSADTVVSQVLAATLASALPVTLVK